MTTDNQNLAIKADREMRSKLGSDRPVGRPPIRESAADRHHRRQEPPSPYERHSFGEFSFGPSRKPQFPQEAGAASLGLGVVAQPKLPGNGRQKRARRNRNSFLLKSIWGIDTLEAASVSDICVGQQAAGCGVHPHHLLLQLSRHSVACQYEKSRRWR